MATYLLLLNRSVENKMSQLAREQLGLKPTTTNTKRNIAQTRITPTRQPRGPLEGTSILIDKCCPPWQPSQTTQNGTPSKTPTTATATTARPSMTSTQRSGRGRSSRRPRPSGDARLQKEVEERKGRRRGWVAAPPRLPRGYSVDGRICGRTKIVDGSRQDRRARTIKKKRSLAAWPRKDSAAAATWII